MIALAIALLAAVVAVVGVGALGVAVGIGRSIEKYAVAAQDLANLQLEVTKLLREAEEQDAAARRRRRSSADVH